MSQPATLNWNTSAAEHANADYFEACVLPHPLEVTAPFWAAANRRALLLPRLKTDGFVHPRILVERGVSSDQIEWLESTGASRLVASAVVWQSKAASFAARTPYTVLLARLDEGIQLVGVIPGAHENLVRGQRLRLGFVKVAPGHLLPTFVPEDV